jgi:sugar phosphate isomerase/epimerase
MTGYDYVLSIEHEDSLMSVEEGLSKAVTFLDSVLLKATPGQAYWA